NTVGTPIREGAMHDRDESHHRLALSARGAFPRLSPHLRRRSPLQQWFTPHAPLASCVDVLGQERGCVGYAHEAAGFVDVHHVGPAAAQHHIHPEEIDAEGAPAAPGKVTELRGEGERLAGFILVRTERPYPPHPKQAAPNAKDLQIVSVRLLVALRKDRLVRWEVDQLADMPDDPDGLPTG